MPEAASLHVLNRAKAKHPCLRMKGSGYVSKSVAVCRPLLTKRIFVPSSITVSFPELRESAFTSVWALMLVLSLPSVLGACRSENGSYTGLHAASCAYAMEAHRFVLTSSELSKLVSSFKPSSSDSVNFFVKNSAAFASASSQLSNIGRTKNLNDPS